MRTRSYCYTLNNYNEQEYRDLYNLEVRYHIIAEEVGEAGTPHLQGYIDFKQPKSLKQLKEISDRTHWEPRKGTPQQASEYCKKAGNFVEIGTLPQQGKRNDLKQIVDNMINGTDNLEKILTEEPMLYHQYGRTLEKVEDLKLKKLKRDFMTLGIWIYGETGVGKTKYVNDLHKDDLYFWNYTDNGWQDLYEMQDNILFDDFRGQIEYSYLLRLVDAYPINLSRRGRQPIPFMAKTVYVTSSLPPEEVYCNLAARDSLDQLYRRFQVFQMKDGILYPHSRKANPDFTPFQ